MIHSNTCAQAYLRFLILRALGQKSVQVIQGCKQVGGEVPEIAESFDVVVACTRY